MSNKKTNGVYYTPDKLAAFLVLHSFQYLKAKKISILEPGCGDGKIVGQLLEYLKNNNSKEVLLDLIEKDEIELIKAASKLKNYNGVLDSSSRILKGDYLEFHFNDDAKYNLIIGNPPYIKKGHLTKQQKELIKNIHEQAGLKGFVKNIWTAFLVSAVLKIKRGGVLAFVLPSELLQTSYSNEIRDFVLKRFDKVQIFSFKELVFENIEQDVVILVAAGRSKLGCKELEYIQLQNLDSLVDTGQQKSSVHTHVNGTKWTNYILTEEELDLIKYLKKKLPKIGDYCTTSPGVVTAANSFFIKNNEFVENTNLMKYAKKILQKSSYSQNKIIFGKEAWNNLRDKGSPCYLLDFTVESTLSKEADIYIKHGEDENIHKRYKCQRRHPWYSIPSLNTTEVVYGKRSNLYPRMIVNKENFLVTDSFYRIFMKDEYSSLDLVYSFHNKLTFIFAELNGRQYGGGVLELTPNEFRSLPILLIKASYKDIKFLDNKLTTEGIGSVLELTDKLILQDVLQLSAKDIDVLTHIYKKLLGKRVKGIPAQMFPKSKSRILEDSFYSPISSSVREFV